MGLEDRLESEMDPLTQIPNLRGFDRGLYENLQRIVRILLSGSSDKSTDYECADDILERHFNLHEHRSRQFENYGIYSIAILDLDDFKAINSIRGYDAGDKVLINFSTELQRVVHRDNDHVATEDHIGRKGGEEFYVFLHNTKIVTLKRILDIFSKNHHVSNPIDGDPISFSAGVFQIDIRDEYNRINSLFKNSGLSIDEFLASFSFKGYVTSVKEAMSEKAEIAADVAKILGKGRTIVYSEEAQEIFEVYQRVIGDIRLIRKEFIQKTRNLPTSNYFDWRRNFENSVDKYMTQYSHLPEAVQIGICQTLLGSVFADSRNDEQSASHLIRILMQEGSKNLQGDYPLVGISETLD